MLQGDLPYRYRGGFSDKKNSCATIEGKIILVLCFSEMSFEDLFWRKNILFWGLLLISFEDDKNYFSSGVYLRSIRGFSWKNYFNHGIYRWCRSRIYLLKNIFFLGFVWGFIWCFICYKIYFRLRVDLAKKYFHHGAHSRCDLRDYLVTEKIISSV